MTDEQKPKKWKYPKRVHTPDYYERYIKGRKFRVQVADHEGELRAAVKKLAEDHNMTYAGVVSECLLHCFMAEIDLTDV